MTKKAIIASSIAAAVVIAVTVILILSLRVNNRLDASDIDYLCIDGVEEPVSQVNGENYIFLPSFERKDSIVIRLDETYEGLPVTANGVELASGGVTRVPIENRETIEFEAGTRKLSVNISRCENVPALFISTESGSMTKVDADQEYREAGSLQLIGADGATLAEDKLEYIKGRGNQTWRYSKKPYNIKLDSKTDILDMGSAKEWSLIANYLDESGIRNRIVYDFAEELGFAYSPSCEYVDLWLNGKYMGLYLITEKVEIKKNRLNIYDLEEYTEMLNGDLSRFTKVTSAVMQYYNIKNDPEDITQGYIIELENEQRYAAEASWFKLRDGTAFTVKTPEYVSKAQMEYISSFVQSVTDALDAENGIDPRTGKHYTELIDMESFAKKYIVEEFSANKDCEWSSQYFYVSEGKLYAGPVWDYDHTFGNGGYPIANPETLTVTWRTTYKQTDSWYAKFLLREDFMDLVCEIYKTQARPIIDRLIDTYGDELEGIAGSVEGNDLRWYGKKEDRNCEQDRADLLAYIEKRAEFLDRLWIEKEELVYVYFVGIGIEHYYSMMVTPGTTLAQIGDTGLDISVSEAVIAEIGGMEADINAPITENKGFYVTHKSERTATEE